MIKVLKRTQIDTDRWNSVIASSAFENIYPYSWYLDHCADYWMGLSMGDYECIMPVVFRKKIGIKYVYQPYYCQQLGVHSSLPVDSEIVRMFLHKLGTLFKMGDYAFNAGNVLGNEKGFEETDNANYVLNLNQPFEILFENYSDNCRRNVNKAYRNGLTIDKHVSIDEMLALKKISEKNQQNTKLYAHREKLLSLLNELKKIEIIGVRAGQQLLAAAVFVKSINRVTYLLSASGDRGKELKGMFMIVDSFIQQYEETPYKLDFEGSNIASIARFFRGFGAKPEIYQRISIQNPPYKIMQKFRGG